MTKVTALLLRAQYEQQRTAARIIAPVMRLTGFRFSKASRDNRLLNVIVCRVTANLLADGIEPGRLNFGTERDVTYRRVVAGFLVVALVFSLGLALLCR